MSKKKCHGCGVVDSIHVKDEGRSQLVSAFGPKDEDGLQMYFIYCRACHAINIYKPGWIGNIKFDSLIDTRELFEAYKTGQIAHHEIGFIAGKIQRAMIEDGILPKNWTIT